MKGVSSVGGYIKDKKQMEFKSIDALLPVQKVIEEAGIALKDKSRRIQDSPIHEALGGAVGVGTGGVIGFTALYFGGSVTGLSAAGITSGLAAAGSIVGGGMAAGIATLAAPAVVLGAVGVGVSSHIKNQKLKEAKELCYQQALQKQTAILKLLKEEQRADKERIKYLTGLNTLLQSALRDLEHDLGIAT